MIEHCISALNYNNKKENERKSFEIYVTDALMAISSNTTQIATLGGVQEQGNKMRIRWIDLLEPPEIAPIDNRPCEEIAQDIFARIRGNKQ